MKTAEELTHDLLLSEHTVGYQRSHIIKAMEQYATQQVKAFQNDLKQFIQANPKATVKQILEHFNI